jgi:hypothetical protein
MATVGTQWINKFRTACNQKELKYCDDTARGFGNAMKSRGHSWIFDWGNDNAWESDWRDPAHAGHDNNTAGGADSVDFAYLSTHGGSSSAHFVAAFGVKKDHCLWDNRKGRLGNTRCNWAVMDTCESLLFPNPHHKWHHCFHGLHMVLGFKGSTSDSWWTKNRGWDFGRRVGNGAKISGAWLDEAYSWWAKDYPAAMACGRTEADAKSRVFNERITSGYSDIPNNQIAWYWWRWRS